MSHPDNNDVLPLSGNETAIPVALQLSVPGHQQTLLVLREELHRKVHPRELFPGSDTKQNMTKELQTQGVVRLLDYSDPR